MLKLSGAQAPPGGFLGRLAANAGHLAAIRPLDARLVMTTARGTGAPRDRRRQGRYRGALADLGKLAAATRAPAQGWIEKANARQAALTAARRFAADTALALAAHRLDKAGAQ